MSEETKKRHFGRRMDDREGSESHLYITPGWEISTTTQNCCRQIKVCKKSPVTDESSFPHSLCFPSRSYSPPPSVSAMHSHTHSSHASTFLLLSSSISPFLHLLLCLPVSFSPFSLPPCNTFLRENRTRPGLLRLLAWVVSRRIKNGWTPMLYSCVKLVKREGS